MEFFIKVLILVAMIRLLVATNKPLLCAAIYAGSAFVLDAVFSGDLVRVIMMSGLAFAGAFAYFWILDRINSLAIWWLAVMVGVPLVLL